VVKLAVQATNDFTDAQFAAQLQVLERQLATAQREQADASHLAERPAKINRAAVYALIERQSDELRSFTCHDLRGVVVEWLKVLATIAPRGRSASNTGLTPPC
jgi:hypothetical protein